MKKTVGNGAQPEKEGFETIPSGEPILFPLQVLVYTLRDYWRPHMATRVKAGIEETLPMFQKYRSPFFDLFFSIASFCGSEDFYVFCFPVIYWEFNQKLSLLLLTLFGINVYLSNALKNMFRLPRPLPLKSDKKMVLDNGGYGFPSMHSMNAISLPFFLLAYLTNYELPWYSSNTTLHTIYLIACIWVLWIVGSRLYLAVHSPLDVEGGLFLGLSTLYLFITFGEWVIDWVLYHPNFVSVFSALTFVYVGLVLLHPFPFNKTLAETSGLLGTVYGFQLGSRFNPYVIPRVMSTQFCSVSEAFLLPIVRSVVGMIGVLVIIEISKKIVQHLVLKTLGKDSEMLSAVVAKFLSYVIVTLSLTCIIPLLWHIIGYSSSCVSPNLLQFL